MGLDVCAVCVGSKEKEREESRTVCFLRTIPSLGSVNRLTQLTGGTRRMVQREDGRAEMGSKTGGPLLVPAMGGVSVGGAEGGRAGGVTIVARERTSTEMVMEGGVVGGGRRERDMDEIMVGVAGREVRVV